MADHWEVKPVPELWRDLMTAESLHPVTARVLAARGYTADAALKRFLKNDLNDLSLPFDLPGLETCAERLQAAIARKERIVVHGDYDVDGITATSILIRFLQTAGCAADFFIPDRIDDGYGVTVDSAAKLAARQPALVVTVDCGISAVEPVRALRAGGADVIITDHHLVHGPVPETPYIVNPKLHPGHPAEHLAAAGIAFFLAWGTAQKLSGGPRVTKVFREFLLDAMPLATLGTVADIVPLTGDNRILVAHGLKLLGLTSRVAGIEALKRVSELDGARTISTHDIGFRLGPRLNAAGRMDNAGRCVTLMTTASMAEADAIAASLETANRERQKLCETTMAQAVAQVERDTDPGREMALVVADPSWHRGIIGIVAARLAERYRRPTVVLAADPGETGLWHGSGRSVGAFHLTNALGACADLLKTYGGHQGAAGLALPAANLIAFRRAFTAAAAARLTVTDLEESLEIDAEAAPEELDLHLAGELQKLGPFGEGNLRPAILVRSIPLARRPRLVGRSEQHLKLNFILGPKQIADGIGFGLGPRLGELINARTIDLVCLPALNNYQGRLSLDLQIKDFRNADRPR